MNEQPNYYAIIPANVRYSNVTANAKLLYGELTALTSKEGYCWASNQYFADLYGVNKNTVSAWVSELVQAGFIKITVRRNYERKIYLMGVPGNPVGGTRKSCRGDTENPVKSTTVSTTNNTSETDVSQGDIIEVVDDPKPKRKKTPDIPMQVYSLFGEVIGKSPLNWRTNKTQRTCAENLYTERGIEQIRKALRGYIEYKNEPFCPTINSPYDLDSKWSNLYEFIKKQD